MSNDNDIDCISLEQTNKEKEWNEWIKYLEQLITKYTMMEKVKIPANHLRAGNLHLSEKLSIPILQCSVWK